jgi:hypothetical protein
MGRTWRGARFGAGLAALVLTAVAPASAQEHEHMLIGSSAAGGGAVILQYDFTRQTVVGPPTFSSIDPSFAPVLVDDPGVPIFSLAEGTTVRVEIVALDAGTSLTVSGTKLDHPGARKKVGDAPVLHNHVTWALDVPAGVTGEFHISFKMIASGPYADSPVYTLTITNLAPTTTTSSSTSSTTASSTTSSTTTPSTVPTAPDAQLCYRAPLAKGEPDFEARTLTLDDRFGPASLDVKDVWGACNPVDIGVSPVVHPDVGFERLTAKSPKGAPGFLPQRLTVIDALGVSVALDLVKPERLLVPGGMAPAGTPPVIPPDAVSGSPGAVHHLACYHAKLPRGAAKPTPPAGLAVTDRFGPVMLDLSKPTAVCVPADAGGDPAAADASDAVVCWQAKPAKHTPKPARRLDERASTEFGAHQLDVKAVAELCIAAVADPRP